MPERRISRFCVCLAGCLVDFDSRPSGKVEGKFTGQITPDAVPRDDAQQHQRHWRRLRRKPGRRVLVVRREASRTFRASRQLDEKRGPSRITVAPRTQRAAPSQSLASGRARSTTPSQSSEATM